MAQRDVANQKGLRTALYHALPPWRLPEIYYCLFYLLLCSTALKGLCTGCLQGAFIRWGFFPYKERLQTWYFSPALRSFVMKLSVLNHNSPKPISFKRFNSAPLKPTRTDNRSLFISVRNAAFSECTYPIIFLASQAASHKLNRSHLQKWYPFEVRLFS